MKLPIQNMIGIFGGTFDPVHVGHLRLAEQVQDQLSLDQIQFLPCANPVHRDQPLANNNDRLKMLELAIPSRTDWRINRVELERGGRSYTIDSLRLIRAQQQGSLCLLVGVDAFNAFLSWKSPEQILELAHLVVCRRPGTVLDRSIFNEQQINDPSWLQSTDSGLILPLDIDENPCSSTEVRRLLGQGESALSCLPSAVSDYIYQHQLYGTKRE